MLCRALPNSNWMRVAGEERDILPGALFSSVAFALIHSTNLLRGAALSSTLFQICYAFALGFFFSAVFLRSGSIWPTVTMHTLIDFTSFLTSDMGNVGVLSEGLEFGIKFYIIVAASIILFFWGLFFIRGAKRREIVELWAKKWHKGHRDPGAINEGNAAFVTPKHAAHFSKTR